MHRASECGSQACRRLALLTRRRGPVGRGGQSDDLERGAGFLRSTRGRHAIKSKQRLDELLPAEPAVHLIVLRTVAEASHHRHVVPWIFSEQLEGALVRVQLAD